MNTFGFSISFIFLISCISVLWGVFSYDGAGIKKKEAVKSGLYAFSAIGGISLVLALMILFLS